MAYRIRIDEVQSAYRRHSGLYDHIFGRILQSGRKQVVERMRCRPGERVLEVGVGTGISLPLYPRGVRIIGVDLSQEMLAKARGRASALGGELAVMDASRLAFSDRSFDKVVAMYVASTVPDPAGLVEEMRRVCASREGLYFVNHFEHSSPIVAAGERLLAPLGRWLGFRPDFSLDRFVRAARLRVVERAPAGPLGYWTFLRGG